MTEFIVKYEIDAGVDHQQVSMHMGAQPLAIKFRRGMLFLWARVPADPSGALPYLKEWRIVRVVRTGRAFELDSTPNEFVGTIADDQRVLHVFVHTAAV